MTIQQSDLTKANEDFAVLFPSISSIYVKFVSRPEKLIPAGRLPAGLPHGAESLNFLNKDKGLFTYKYGLYSAGHAEWNLEKSDDVESMIQKRDRENTVVMGDSGGFQIATGVIKFPWKPKPALPKLDSNKKVMLDNNGSIIYKTPAQTKEDWMDEKDDIRLGILRWLEHTADLSMILDLPTASIARGHVESFDDCKRETLENMDFFVKHRVPGKTRFLNILQGISEGKADDWWDAVKNYPFEGYAFGGENCANFYFIVKRMLQMRDGKYFDKHPDGYFARNWLHFLGISRLPGTVAFTALQRVLRQKVDPTITISFDAASAFVSVAHGQIYTGYNTRANRLGYCMDHALDNKAYKGSTDPFPWKMTNIGSALNIGDICVRGVDDRQKNGQDAKTSWDSFSYVLLMSHSAELQIQAVQEANRLFRCKRQDTEQWIPGDMYDFQEVIEEIFQKEHSHDTAHKYVKELNRTSKTTFNNSELFTEVDVLKRMDPLTKHRKLLEEITTKLMGKGESSFSDHFVNEKHDGKMGLDEAPEVVRE